MKVKHQNFDVIHPLENPYDKQGGLSVLFETSHLKER